MISPASIVFPKPVSSAINRLTRGSWSAFRSGSIWYASILIPARNGAWKREGSVAVVQLQRSVLRKAAKVVRLVEAAFPEVGPGLVVENGAVEFAVPEDLQFLALGVVVCTGEADARGFARVGGGGDLLDQPASGADPDHLADAGVALGEVRVGEVELSVGGFHGWQSGYVIEN